MLPFHITRKVAIRHKKRREAICFMVERIAIIYIESEVQTMRTVDIHRKHLQKLLI